MLVRHRSRSFPLGIVGRPVGQQCSGGPLTVREMKVLPRSGLDWSAERIEYGAIGGGAAVAKEKDVMRRPAFVGVDRAGAGSQAPAGWFIPAP